MRSENVESEIHAEAMETGLNEKEKNGSDRTGKGRDETQRRLERFEEQKRNQDSVG